MVEIMTKNMQPPILKHFTPKFFGVATIKDFQRVQLLQKMQ